MNKYITVDQPEDLNEFNVLRSIEKLEDENPGYEFVGLIGTKKVLMKKQVEQSLLSVLNN